MHVKDNDMSNVVAIYLLDQTDWFVQVINLTQGMQFGELALINEKPRAATIVCEKSSQEITEGVFACGTTLMELS